MTSEVVVAVDVGGTTIKGVLVDREGRTLGGSERPTPVTEGPDAVVAAVRDTVTAVAASAQDVVRAVGVAVPGEVGATVARYAANLGWRDVPASTFGTGLTSEVPVVLGHDVRCAALADRSLGATRGVDEACVIVVGTGIASVMITQGHPVEGARRLAGELGHVPVFPDGEVCACGQRGCLEAYASAAAVVRRYAARTGRTLTAQEIVAAMPHDQDAADVWSEAIDALGRACVSVTMLQDPALIALAGGLSEAGEALLGPLRKAVAEGLVWRSAPEVVLSPLGGRAGRYGAALLAWESLGRNVDPGSWEI